MHVNQTYQISRHCFGWSRHPVGQGFEMHQFLQMPDQWFVLEQRNFSENK